MPKPRPPLLRALLVLLACGVVAAPAVATPADAAAGAACEAAIALAEREAGIPAGLLQAIGRVESGRRDPATGRISPWPWTINAEGRGMYFPTREAAIAEVRQLQARGVRLIDIGCLQVNLHHHPHAFPTLEQAFDPLANARYAARFLTELQASRGDWAISAGHFHSQTPERAEGYRARVLAAWAAERDRPAREPGADAAALARLAGLPARSGPRVLSNGAERAEVIAAAQPGRGRGLDAYRAAPIPLVGRPAAVLSAPSGPAAAPSRPSPLAFFRRPG